MLLSFGRVELWGLREKEVRRVIGGCFPFNPTHVHTHTQTRIQAHTHTNYPRQPIASCVTNIAVFASLRARVEKAVSTRKRPGRGRKVECSSNVFRSRCAYRLENAPCAGASVVVYTYVHERTNAASTGLARSSPGVHWQSLAETDRTKEAVWPVCSLPTFYSLASSAFSFNVHPCRFA